MKQKNPDLVIHEIARDHISKEVNLLPGLLAKVTEENKRGRGLKRKLLIAIPTISVLLMLVIVSVPVTASTLSRLMGYIPGVGLVDKSTPIRMLSAPVKATRDEVTITVKRALLDSQHSLVSYSVENLFYPDEVNSPRFQAERCSQLPYLRLENGNKLEGSGNFDNIWSSGYSRQLSYPAIPADTQNAVLVFSCLEQTMMKVPPENWEIPLRFIPTPPEKIVYPLIDSPAQTAKVKLPTPIPNAVLPTPEIMAAKIVSVNDFGLSFDRYTPLDEGYVIYGKLQSQNPDAHFMWIDPNALHLSDSQGREIELTEDNPSDQRSAADRKQYPLAYKTGPVLVPGPTTLTFDSIWVNQMVDTSFVFDPGLVVRPGQIWQINRDIKIAGHTLRVESASLDAAGKGLTFNFDQNSEIQTAVLTDPDLPLTSADGGGGGEGSAGIFYANGFPHRSITVKVSVISFILAGPWKTTIDLPVQTGKGNPTPPVKSCLTKESWENAPDLKENDLDAGLDGILAISYISSDDAYYNMMVARLDGSKKQLLGRGEGVVLSPDGTKGLYNGLAGLEMFSLPDLKKSTFPGTRRGDRGAIWSPDGKQLAFTRGPASGLISAPGPHQIWISDADGSNAREITQGRDANQAMAWMPDGKSILNKVEKENGSSIRMINVDTGEVKPLFEINYSHGNLAISPDGKRLAFEQMLPGDKYAIYISDLDGSNQRLVAAPDSYVATSPFWSPDGKWLIFSIHKNNSEAYSPDLGLVQVDTCQIFRLPQLFGYVSTWYRQE